MSGQCKRRPTAKSNPARTTQVRLQLLTCAILKYHRRQRGGEEKQRGERRDTTAGSESTEGRKNQGMSKCKVFLNVNLFSSNYYYYVIKQQDMYRTR